MHIDFQYVYVDKNHGGGGSALKLPPTRKWLIVNTCLSVCWSVVYYCTE